MSLRKIPKLLDYELDKGWKTNVVGVIYSINAFLPLVKKGTVKKVIGVVDRAGRRCRSRDSMECGSRQRTAINKAALNTAIAKYAARYATEGIFFLSISPGDG